LSYPSKHGTRRVPQWLPLAGQLVNSAGGRAWAVDDWTRLRRFLVLGSEGGSNSPGMLDVVGFDTTAPQLSSDFARGAL
jgi:60 kDa SS-A/Ro ribonucleoprotein